MKELTDDNIGGISVTNARISLENHPLPVKIANSRMHGYLGSDLS